MTTEEKRMRFFDMQDHPERYSDEEFQQMLADPEMQEFINTMTDFRQATIMEEMKEEKPVVMVPVHRFTTLRKIAAVTTGILFVSGLSFAAVQLGIIGNKQSNTEQTKTEQTLSDERIASGNRNIAKQTFATDTIAKRDTLTAPVIYEEAELHTILSAVADHYGIDVNYKTETSRIIRLYFVWNPADKLDAVVAQLNKFDRISIRIENKSLIVE